MDVGDIISCIACVVSVVCAVLTFLQFRLSHKGYILQKKIYTDGVPKLELSITDNFIYDNKNIDVAL